MIAALARLGPCAQLRAVSAVAGGAASTGTRSRRRGGYIRCDNENGTYGRQAGQQKRYSSGDGTMRPDSGWFGLSAKEDHEASEDGQPRKRSLVRIVQSKQQLTPGDWGLASKGAADHIKRPLINYYGGTALRHDSRSNMQATTGSAPTVHVFNNILNPDKFDSNFDKRLNDAVDKHVSNSFDNELVNNFDKVIDSWSNADKDTRPWPIYSPEEGTKPVEPLPIVSDEQAEDKFVQEDVWNSLDHTIDMNQLRAEELAEDDDESLELEDGVDHAAVLGARRETLLHLDYAKALPTALANGERDLTIRCLYAARAASDKAFVTNLSSRVFSDILRLIQPSNGPVEALGAVHATLSALMVEALGVATMARIAIDTGTALLTIVAFRRSDTVRLELEDYVVLLRSAGILGLERMARIVWKLMTEDEITPTVDCYNYYMLAILNAPTHHPTARHAFRNTVFHRAGRAQKSKRLRSRLFRFGYTGKGGPLDRVVIAYSNMQEAGLIPDVETYRITMAAAARDGDIDFVKSVLRRVWNIDVDTLMKSEDVPMSPVQLPRDSALYPNAELLKALAHAFGLNNDVGTALRVVDYISEQYGVPMSDEVWGELFERTFVLAVSDHSVNDSSKTTDGRVVPRDALDNIWQTMLGPPYNIRPTMTMYNQYIKYLFVLRRGDGMVERAAEGVKLYLQSAEESQRKFAAFRAEVLGRRSTSVDGLSQGLTADSESTKGRPVEQLRHEYELAELIRCRNARWLGRWAGLIMAHVRKRVKIDVTLEWTTVIVPRMLWDLREFVPSPTWYETYGGLVELDIHADEPERKSKPFTGVIEPVRGSFEPPARTNDWRRPLAHREEELNLVDRAVQFVGHEWFRPPLFNPEKARRWKSLRRRRLTRQIITVDGYAMDVPRPNRSRGRFPLRPLRADDLRPSERDLLPVVPVK